MNFLNTFDLKSELTKVYDKLKNNLCFIEKLIGILQKNKIMWSMFTVCRASITRFDL